MPIPLADTAVPSTPTYEIARRENIKGTAHPISAIASWSAEVPAYLREAGMLLVERDTRRLFMINEALDGLVSVTSDDLDGALLGILRNLLWVCLGDGETSAPPVLVAEDGLVLDVAEPKASVAAFDGAAVAALRVDLWIVSGEGGELSPPPDAVSEGGLVLDIAEPKATAAAFDGAAVAALRLDLWSFEGEGNALGIIPTLVSEAGLVLDEWTGNGASALLAAFRDAVWSFSGAAQGLIAWPVRVAEDGRVIETQGARNGDLYSSYVERATLPQFRQMVWRFTGSGEGLNPPSEVSEDGYTLSASFGASGFADRAVAYIVAGGLYIMGGSGPDGVLNDDADKTWLSAVVVGGTVQAIWEDDVGGKHTARVMIADGSVWDDGAIEAMSDDGQSNGESQAREANSIVFPAPPAFKDRLRMPRTASADAWLGYYTSGGASVEIPPGTITGLMDLTDKLREVGSNRYGTTAASAACRREVELAHALSGDWVPDMLIWSNAEGGQDMADILDSAGAGKYYAQNVSTVLTDLAGLPLPRRIAYRWMLMQQGESDSNVANLGDLHSQHREEQEEKAQSILGQFEPVRMLSGQPSSFFSNFDGAQSILDYALSGADPYMYCLGPTYAFPFASDFLHQTSVGHAMRGYLAQAARHEIRNGRGWVPLHPVSASVTGANEITAVLSEAAVIDEDWLVDPTGLANAGVQVSGATVSAVSVTGTTMTITTSDAAAGATAVGTATAGHTGEDRAATGIPRSTIRSVAQFGAFHTGDPIHKPICHRRINIT
ncbi:hypothetical protein [Pseudooceanicola algae]|uniref:Uncharacterized protein n=1 Tax=Pseudooceanicola algae TaxID=1537215 RepID=A0A418SK78_9RHOB|nr:hypothetical protein [Pseudooceanicola algae]QPM89162.1 hypothetical protein PSAL_003730 [Pseudooceanicola algae]